MIKEHLKYFVIVAILVIAIYRLEMCQPKEPTGTAGGILNQEKAQGSKVLKFKTER